jgi:hypothetical protein
VWADLQADNLGGFSGINRPFWILYKFKTVIETFGRRDVGLSWSNDQLDAALSPTPDAGEVREQTGKYGCLREQLDFDIARAGAFESFMIRAGLLSDILDDLEAAQQHLNTLKTIGETAKNGAESITVAETVDRVGASMMRGAIGRRLTNAFTDDEIRGLADAAIAALSPKGSDAGEVQAMSGTRKPPQWADDSDPTGELAIKLAARASAIEEQEGRGEWTWREIAQCAAEALGRPQTYRDGIEAAAKVVESNINLAHDGSDVTGRERHNWKMRYLAAAIRKLGK